MRSRREFLAGVGAFGVAQALGGCGLFSGRRGESDAGAATVLVNGRFATLDPARPRAEAAAIRGGRFIAVGAEADARAAGGAGATVIDLGGRTAIPGLDDSHTHVVRGGLSYDLELRWEGVPSLADAMRRLREQVAKTPPPHWVRVVGGFSEFQFAERRLPTLAELNAAAPETPVFILHLYDRALLNGAALRAVGYGKDTPDPPGGAIERDRAGNPTGLLVAKPNATILYKTLALAPRLDPAAQSNSTRRFMRELNRLGVTSVIDAGGGFQSYPDDYAVIDRLWRDERLTVRIAYNLFTQRPGQELEDFAGWARSARPGQGDGFYRLNGAGEMLVYSAADFEDFVEPRPDLAPAMESQLDPVVRLLARERWPFRLHATYDESISRFLDVFERVDREVPFDGLRFTIDHAETISPRNIDRVRALGGGIAIQHRMAFQGERFAERYGRAAAALAPPVARMLAAGVPVGLGTDATRVASYNPWVALRWLSSGLTVGGLALHGEGASLDRTEALRLMTRGSAWFSGEENVKGAIAPGALADLAVLSEDYFSVPAPRIAGIESVLTLVGGKVVHGAAEFARLAPAMPPPAPSWAPAAGSAPPPAPVAARARGCACAGV